MMDYNLYFTKWKREVAAERLLEFHLNRVAEYRDTDRAKYASSVDTLILLSPKRIREACREYRKQIGLDGCRYRGIDDEIMRKYDMLLAFTLERLEDENLIYRKREIWLWGAEGEEPQRITY